MKIYILTFIAILAITIACKNNSTDADPSDSDTNPEITSIAPDEGPLGTAVTIFGSGFNSTASQNTVTFNGTTNK